jgi:serine/threonine protein kinase
MIPKNVNFDSGQIDIIRVLGKMYIQWSKTNEEIVKDGTQATTIRVFEAKIPDGTKCYVKEYLPIGQAFGRRELLVSRKLISRWNEITGNKSSNEVLMNNKVPPFAALVGNLVPDERIEEFQFRAQWLQRFPRTKPPEKGNLWLVFQWDESSFRTVKKFPGLPQVVEGLDYFRKDRRDCKRWRFVRKVMRCGLEAVEFLHQAGFCHNAINSDTLWLTTSDQLRIDQLLVQVTDLGACQRLADLGPLAREAVLEDLYQLGLVYLELVIASFSEDNKGAQIARTRISHSETALFFIYSNLFY